jgi:hypothetical protein
VQEAHELRRQRTEPHEVFVRVRVRGELSDRERGSVDRERRDDRVHARAVGQTSVDVRGGLVDAAPHARDDLVDRPAQVVLVAEPGVRAEQLARALDVDRRRAVHHDLGDLRVTDERLERAETQHDVPDLLDDLRLLLDRERDVLLVEQRAEPVVNELAKLRIGQGIVVQPGTERLDQASLNVVRDLAGAVRPVLLGQTFRERHP